MQPKEPYERARGVLRFRTTVPAGETVTYPVQLERMADQSVALTDLGLDQIRFYLKTKAVSPALQKALERVVALRTELDEASRNRADLERSLAEAIQDETRIRENLRTLQRDTDAYRRQLERFGNSRRASSSFGRRWPSCGRSRNRNEKSCSSICCH